MGQNDETEYRKIIGKSLVFGVVPFQQNTELVWTGSDNHTATRPQEQVRTLGGCRSQLNSNYRHNNNCVPLLELGEQLKERECGERWRRGRGEGGGCDLISKWLYLDYWLFNVYQIAFPPHCAQLMFDLHDEQMISFSWNRSSKTLQRELWPDAVDLAVWETGPRRLPHVSPKRGAPHGSRKGSRKVKSMGNDISPAIYLRFC